MTPARIKLDTFGFPSSLISPADKQTREYYLLFEKAFHREHNSGTGFGRIKSLGDDEKNRLYAKGMQPQDQYKPMLGIIRNKGKKDISWRNLDWNILPILPTLVSVVKNKVLSQKKDVIIKAIDRQSQTEERTRKNEILTYLTNLHLAQQAEQDFGVPVESPLDPGAPLPANMQELELHLQMFPKDRYVMELYDNVERVKTVNNWTQIWEDVVDDLVSVGQGGTKCYIDINGSVRVRRVKKEALITNNIVNADFSDLTRIGEYIQMSISELRASVPRGTFTEAEYAKMASTATGKNYTTKGVDQYFRTNYCYPYDHEKLTVLDAEWIAADDYAYVVERSNIGNLMISKQKDPYWLDKVEWNDNGKQMMGVTDQQYIDYHKNLGSEKEIIRDSVNNLYGAKWIVGTDYVFDYGLKSNIQRSLNRLGDCKFNYNLYTFFDSYMRRAEPLADQIQLNWLQHQHHVSQSKPSGLKINKRALTSISVGGKGGMELDELEVLRMYTETGNYVYKGEDAAGRPYQFDPIQELKGGMNEAAIQHFELMKAHIDLLRTIFGLNEATDSSTPNPKLGKAIAEMLEQNTNTALGSVYHAYSKLFEDTIKSICTLVADAELIKNSAKDESLGTSSGEFFRANSDVTHRELGIKIEDGPTTEVRNTLRKYIELSLGNKEIYPEDSYLVENEDNIMRAYHMLAQARKKKKEDDMRIAQQQYDMEQEKNIQSAMAGEQAKVQLQMQANQSDIEKAYAIHDLDMEKLVVEQMGNLRLKQLELGYQENETDKELMASLNETLIKVRAQIQIAQENRKAAKASKPAARKSA